MNAISFDTLAYFDKFKDAGFTEEQARVQTEAMQDWVEAIRDDREPFVQGKDGIPVVQIIEAVYESARTGETVYIKEAY